MVRHRCHLQGTPFQLFANTWALILPFRLHHLQYQHYPQNGHGCLGPGQEQRQHQWYFFHEWDTRGGDGIQSYMRPNQIDPCRTPWLQNHRQTLSTPLQHFCYQPNQQCQSLDWLERLSPPPRLSNRSRWLRYHSCLIPLPNLPFPRSSTWSMPIPQHPKMEWPYSEIQDSNQLVLPIRKDEKQKTGKEHLVLPHLIHFSITI